MPIQYEFVGPNRNALRYGLISTLTNKDVTDYKRAANNREFGYPTREEVGKSLRITCLKLTQRFPRYV